MKRAIDNLEPLIGALREELQQYGEMLALLDRQQEQVKARSADEIFQSISLIQAQAGAIQGAREHRERCRREAAQQCGEPENAPFGRLIPRLPADYRPLVTALVEENNQLLGRVRQRARQNHVLLRRSVELMRELLRTLFPARQTSVYNGNGHKRAPSLISRSIYNAVG
ncbi:MAG: flagellar export chaperone FlgN [Verrucomicrobiota bacterium]|jgi:flagellar biosynthesis/type III secretory pathway chaperone